MIHKKISMANFLLIFEYITILIDFPMRVCLWHVSPKPLFFPFCPVVQDHSNFKMCFPWKMKILMIWLLLTKRFFGILRYLILSHLYFSVAANVYCHVIFQNNVFVMSNKKSKYPILQVDLRLVSLRFPLYWSISLHLLFQSPAAKLLGISYRLISDLVVIIVFAAIGGIVFSCLGQPVCNLTN